MVHRSAWIAIAVGLLAAPLPAAGCPVAADLAHGVFVAFADGSVARYTRMPRRGERAIFEDTAFAGEEDRFGVVLRDGIVDVEDFSIRGGRIVEATRVVTTLTGAPGDIAAIPVGETLTLGIVTEDDGRRRTGSLAVTRGAEEALALGACSFAAETFTLAKRWLDGEWTRQSIRYLPEIGIGILVEADFGEDRLTLEIESIGTDFPPHAAVAAGD